MDINQYLDLFLDESAEHVQSLNQNLLSLENNPDRLDLLDEIFRSAHTLKGMSATMGFETIAQLTHQMENVLGKLRERRIILSAPLLNCLFKAVDLLEAMLSAIREGEEPPKAPAEIIEALLAFETGQPVPHAEQFSAKSQNSPEKSISQENSEADKLELNEFEQNLLGEAVKKGYKSWYLKISVVPGCLMKSVRAFMVFRNLETIGEIIKSVPGVQDIEDEKFEDSFSLVLVTEEGPEKIKGQLDIISEIKVDVMEEIEQTYASPDISAGEAAAVKQEDSQEKKHQQRVHQTVRVDINRLDKLMSLVGELVINKTRLEQINESNQLSDLNETIEQINRITTDLQSVVQNVRMVSVEQVFNRFPRMVRDLSLELGKEVNLILEGKETELDRTVIDEIGDPLVHLIRNAIDHGFESAAERVAANKKEEGTLKLTAKQEGNHVYITVEDDGRGIDLQGVKRKAVQNGIITPAQAEEMDEQSLINLIFEPGFSTADTVTDISGRGVGLDVVVNKIQSLSGHVSVETKPGKGTNFIIKLPLTLAIIQALLVDVNGETYAIPLANIDETTILDPGEVKNIQEQQVMVLRGKVLPLFFLDKILEVPGEREGDEMYVVVVRKGEHQVGLVVAELIGQQEIVINSIGKHLIGLSGIAGASILGDGRVSLILDVGTLI